MVAYNGCTFPGLRDHREKPDPCRNSQRRPAAFRLEIEPDETVAAAAHLDKAGIVRCDAIEMLPEGFRGFQVARPANIVHLVVKLGRAGSSGENET